MTEFKIGKPIYWSLSDKFKKTQHDIEEEEEERIEVEKEIAANATKKKISCVQCEDEEGKVMANPKLLRLN